MVEQGAAKLASDLLKNQVTSLVGMETRKISQQYGQELGGVVTRLAAIESILMDKLGLDEADLLEEVAKIEDKALGFEVTTDSVKEGDLVRLSVVGKPEDQEEYTNEPALVKVHNVGVSPFQLPKELEEGILGHSEGEELELKYADDTMVAKIVIERISRKIDEKSESTEG
jgi:hypothetical protein